MTKRLLVAAFVFVATVVIPTGVAWASQPRPRRWG